MTTNDKVLFIDDEPTSILLVKSIVSNTLQLTVAHIENAKEAMAYIDKNKRDLIAVILDLNMPEMDGIQVLKEIREKYSSDILPVIFLTGADFTTEDLNVIFHLGATDVLAKVTAEGIPLTILINRLKTYIAFHEEKKNNKRSKVKLTKWLSKELSKSEYQFHEKT